MLIAAVGAGGVLAARTGNIDDMNMSGMPEPEMSDTPAI
jgi:hypothetical protein